MNWPAGMADLKLRAMREDVVASFQRQGHRDCLMRNLPQRQNCPKVAHYVDFCGEKWAAAIDLGGQWLVLWRNAPDGIADAHAAEFKTIVRTRPVVTLCKPLPKQCAIKQLPGIIAGEWPACFVGALETGGKSNNQEPRIKAAKAWDWVVEEIGKLRPIAFAEVHEARATWAIQRGLMRKTGRGGHFPSFQPKAGNFASSLYQPRSTVYAVS